MGSCNKNFVMMTSRDSISRHTHTHTRTHTHIHTHTHIYIHMYTHTQSYFNQFMGSCNKNFVMMTSRDSISRHTHTRTHTHIHKHTHTYIYICIHTHSPVYARIKAGRFLAICFDILNGGSFHLRMVSIREILLLISITQ